MIDVEADIFNEVSQRVRDKYPGIFMTGEYVRSPSSFPCVSLIEVDNSTLRDTQTNEGKENHVVVVYELNVYSNKTKGKKAECKEIIGFIDEILMGLNFTRIMMEPIPNQDDVTVYRMLGRYRAVISKNNEIFRR